MYNYRRKRNILFSERKTLEKLVQQTSVHCGPVERNSSIVCLTQSYKEHGEQETGNI